MRGSVLGSWKRCRLAGLEPDRLTIPYVSDLVLDDRLRRAAEPVLRHLSASLADVGMAVVLSDGQGRMVERYSGDWHLLHRLDEVRFAPGFDASEPAVGTNGVGTALAGRRPIYLAGREHFADCLQPFACAGAPIRDPLSGHIEAVVDLTCLRGAGDPAMLRLVRDAVHSIEEGLLEQATARERALLAAYQRARRGAPGWSLAERAASNQETEHQDGELGPIDLALLREKAEAGAAAGPRHHLGRGELLPLRQPHALRERRPVPGSGTARAAICIDNARRYTREHNTALALQRSLLPHGQAEQNAVEVAHRYLPAQAGVGGDWFDVIPLSGARVALVVGDVVGHGLHAAATMGRLRTAVQNFCSLDLPAEELLTHLDDLVGALDRAEGWAQDNPHPDSGIVGATCLFAVYDPVSRRCALTRAGHPQPAVVAPDGTVQFVDLPPGPPLGLGGMPFETVELELPEGSQLVMYTDGLIEDRIRDVEAGLDALRAVLACADRGPEDTCEAVLDALLPDRPQDDVALLVARTHGLDAEQVAGWDLPSDPAVVSRARAAVASQLDAWGLEALVFTTELVASELVTNAIRHATGPVRLRLLHDRSLICEVSDGSSTSPRLCRARSEDENGRGLFLVAQLTQRWGTRYTADGKVIWAEQSLP